jgi:titin
VRGISGSGVGLTWKASSDSGGSPIYDYQIEVTRAGEEIWILIDHPESITKTYAVNGLTPGVSYQVRVSAVNAAGYSEFAETVFTTAVVKPTAPLGLDATDVRAGGVTLAWSLPESNGGANLTDYKVEVSSNCSTYTAITHPTSNSLGFDVINLAAGTKYCFRVSAKNTVGYSVPSEVLQVVTLGNAPAAPTALRVSNKSKTSVVLGWAAASVENGSKVRNYVVTYSSDQGASWTTVRKSVSASTSLTVNNLRSATTYWFRVAAVNDVGTSEVQQNPLVVVTR